MNPRITGESVSNEHGLKCYELIEEGVKQWVVSGVSDRSGKRWRRRFGTQEAAEEFFDRMTRRAVVGKEGADVRARFAWEKEVRPKSRSNRALDAGGRWRVVGYKGCIVLLVVCASFFVDVKYSGLWRIREGERRTAHDFQRNPSLAGWEASETGAAWRADGGESGERTLVVREGNWLSPPRRARSFSWYRVAFRTRESVEGKAGNAFAHVEFEAGSGHPLHDVVKLPLRVGAEWIANDFRVRVPGLGAEGGRAAGLRVRCRFGGTGDGAWLVDDFVCEPVSDTEVGQWADILYARMGARLGYQAKGNRWSRIPETLRRLRDHQRLRIAFAGGEVGADLASTPIDVFLRRMYPGAIIELMGPRGVPGNNVTVQEWVESTKPDLVIFAGNGDEANRGYFHALHDALKTRGEGSAAGVEMLVVTDGWVLRNGRADEVLIHSGMHELDQDAAEGIPEDYRTTWRRIAAERQVEFLDVMGILSEFVFGPAVLAKIGPATAPDGVPYQFRLRDWFNSAETGRQVLARIFESYLRPPDAGALIAAVTRKGKAVRLFDPEGNARDRAALESARSVYQPAPLERAVFAGIYSASSPFQTAFGSRVGGGSFRVQKGSVREVGFTFDEPIDVRKGDIAVYWGFRADRSKGEEAGKLSVHLAYAGEDRFSREERAQVSFMVRPGSSAALRLSGELAGVEEVEHEVEVPVENFVEASRVAKFRLLLRWGGADRVVVEAASWNPRARRWESYVPFDRPGAPPLVMDLSISEQLLGSSLFRAIYFETQSEVPFLESVLVTTRPSLIK